MPLAVLNVTGNEISIGIDERTNSVKDKMIFNSEFISYDDKLTGDIKLPKGLVEKDKKYVIYMGKNKSKGFGKAVIEFVPYVDKKDGTIEERIKKLNKDAGREEKNYLITFDFLSDLILPFSSIYDVDKQFRILLPFEKKLEFCSKRSFINTGKLAGFNIVNNMRKADELIICRGSVLTFVVDEYDDILEKLAIIEEKGLGLRKSEGFGRIKICSPRKGGK